MVIVKLLGGLGNQMFQYAAAKTIADKNSVILKIDMNALNRDRLRTYVLNRFRINLPIASRKEIRNLRGVKFPLSGRLYNMFNIPHKQTYVVRYSMGFDPTIYESGPDIYLEGYFQSWRYFQDEQKMIKSQFKTFKELSYESNKILDSVQKRKSVSIHIRRGDYSTDARTRAFHNVCEYSYYKRAVEWIAMNSNDINLFLFSDEPEWVSKNIKFKHPTTFVIREKLPDVHEDLVIMSKCDHNIIPNSTYSWWSAYLNENPKKIVVAPEAWFVELKSKKLEIIPNNWLTI